MDAPRAAAVVLASLIVAVTSAGQACADTDVAHCGQTVTDAGQMTADLDCTGYPFPAIILDRNATLDMQGFVLIAGASDGIACLGRCNVHGGGDVSGAMILGAGNCGIRALGGRLEASDLTIRASEADGVCGSDRLKAELTKVNLEFNRHNGVLAKRLLATDCVATSNTRTGFRATKVTLVRSRVDGSGFVGVSGNFPGSVRLIDSQVFTAGDYGIGNANRVRLERSLVQGAWIHGIRARSVVLRESTIVDSGQAPECGTEVACRDIVSRAKPRLRDSTCETSSREVGGGPEPAATVPWGVCIND